ncbi:MAG: hypothetical protein LBP33_08110 [Candidatus Adiutrix sp.]|jgi:hypothetical protein|nr:hypothetical protein [Candidatus Adiutrix sp.]
MIKSTLLPAAFILLLLCPSLALAQLSLKNGRLEYKAGGALHSVEPENGAAVKVRNSELLFVSINDPEILQAVKKGPGLFFFDESGALKAHYAGREDFDPEMCAAASLSPNGKVIALDNGTWLVRVWTFLNYPGMEPVNPAVEEPFISYLSGEDGQDLIWVDDNTVAVTDISEAPVSRPCPADPCEPFDVVIHALRPWNSSALAKGSELCNYRLKAVEGRNAVVEKVCAKEIEDWGEAEGPRTISRETLTIPRN